MSSFEETQHMNDVIWAKILTSRNQLLMSSIDFISSSYQYTSWYTVLFYLPVLHWLYPIQPPVYQLIHCLVLHTCPPLTLSYPATSIPADTLSCFTYLSSIDFTPSSHQYTSWYTVLFYIPVLHWFYPIQPPVYQLIHCLYLNNIILWIH